MSLKTGALRVARTFAALLPNETKQYHISKKSNKSINGGYRILDYSRVQD